MAEATQQETFGEASNVDNGRQVNNPKECLSCRVMGTGVLAGTGAYAIWQSRATAPGSPGQKRIVAGLGLG